MNLGLLILTLTLEMGWLPQGEMVLYDSPTVFGDVSNWSYTDADVRLSLGPVFVGARMRSTQAMRPPADFAPNSMLYEVSGGIVVGPFEFGMRHMCTHPMMTYLPTTKDSDPIWEGSYDQVYGRVSLRWQAGK